MAVRGLGDGFAFQRLLWLFVGTVIVPTALLALYGVVAIRNERAATSQRVRQQHEQRLRWGAARLFDALADADTRVHELAHSCTPSATPCVQDDGLISTIWVWAANEPPPPHLPGLAPPPSEQRATRWTSLADLPDPAGVYRDGGRVVAWELAMPMVEPSVRQAIGGDGAGVRLERAQAGRAASLEDLMARWNKNNVSVPLERPLGAYALVVDVNDEEGGLARVYLLGLLALLTTILVGTVLTLSSVARELRLSRLQTDFVSHLGHELRTPMTSIRLFVETLRSGRLQDPERINECLDLLGTETERLSRSIERVLEWGRMEAGRRIYEMEPVPPTELVRLALAAHESQTLLDAADTTLTVSIVDDLPPVWGDRDALTDALLNLLQNAHKHTSAPRCVSVRAVARGRGVAFEVADDGPGIPQQERRRVFEKFYQANQLLSRGVEGSGLGLAIVRTVAQDHNGRIELDSEVGRGSTFTLWIPAAK